MFSGSHCPQKSACGQEPGAELQVLSKISERVRLLRRRSGSVLGPVPGAVRPQEACVVSQDAGALHRKVAFTGGVASFARRFGLCLCVPWRVISFSLRA